jgi:5-methyltetrahydrofolate--homocysteine methyltransferase
MSDLYSDLSHALIAGNIETTKELINQALAGGADAQTVLESGLLPGMHIVGERFKAGEMFIPEVLLSARTMRAAMDILHPFLSANGGVGGAGTVVIGTVEGDLHNIGKNLVAMMLEGAGFRVVDLGINVKPQVFVQAVSEHKPEILAMSALLTTTMLRMADTVNALKEANMRDRVKIMVGGAPVTDEFVKRIGGDGYASNAGAAVDKAKELLGQ